MYFNYRWKLTDLPSPTKGKVFSCFAGGGGSSMGYKLAGYDVIGCLEIDKRMIQCYIDNLNPKLVYNEDIRDFNKRTDLPAELYNLDILDGSFPCSSFSRSGNKDKDWGKEKKFREGQKAQILDTLAFDFIETIIKLQPKVIIAENVKGILEGKSKQITIQILSELDKAGYSPQYFLINCADTGVPQLRERVFFIALRKDLCKHVEMSIDKPKLSLNFNHTHIPYKDIEEIEPKIYGKASPALYDSWTKAKYGHCLKHYNPENKFFNSYKINPNIPLRTIQAGDLRRMVGLIHHTDFRLLSWKELALATSFPTDYKCNNLNLFCIITSMSVPPITIASISTEIYNQWLQQL